MHVLIIGGGGREHALAAYIHRNPRVDKLYCLPGNAGIVQLAECAPIPAADIAAIVRFAREKEIDFAIVAPDDPLVAGLVDALHAAGIACFGPEKNAAAIEGSKAFAKELMQSAGIPTAAYRVFTSEADALAYAKDCAYPHVVKADGLALGKGVVIAQTYAEAKEAIHAMMAERRFGASGETVVLEEYLTGPEVSVLVFTDGKTIVPLPAAMDHKRAYDGDIGPNTGGMGAIAPNPYYTPEIAEVCMRRIYLPTMRAMNAAGRTFKGCLYFGLMLTTDGPKVIEYNCRFGDPETQAVLPLLKTDLLEILLAVEEERLDKINVRLRPGACCCVALASGGYPGAYEKGKEIVIEDTPGNSEDVRLFHAGTALEGGRLVTAGGRVLGVSAVADTLQGAVARAYEAAQGVAFEGMQYRHDIGAVALRARR